MRYLLQRILIACSLLSPVIVAANENKIFLDVSRSKSFNCESLNTTGNDFAPSWNKWDKSLYFNSDISGKSLFYISEKIDSINFKPPVLLKSILNKGDNKSYISFENENTAYLSSFRKGSARSYLNIYKTVTARNVWCEPFCLDFLAADYFVAHASVSEDGSKMVFSSNKNNGKDTDLFMVFKQEDGSWGSAVNLDELNSPGNEITPSFASNDVLLFASDGLGGSGGYDIYYSENIEGMWSRPVPIAEINTEFNESDCCCLPDGSLLFASDMPGGKGNLDLYISLPIGANFQAIDKEKTELSILSLISDIKVNVLKEYTQTNFSTVLIEKDNNIFGIALSQNGEPELESFDNYLSKLKQILNETSGLIEIVSPIINNNVDELSAGDLIKKALEIHEPELAEKIIVKNISNKIENEESIYKIAAIINTNGYISQETSSKIEIKPPVVELRLDARPAAVLNHWQMNVLFNEIKSNKILEGSSLPDTVFYDISNQTDNIVSADSIVYQLTASNSQNYSVSLALPLQHFNYRQQNEVEIEGQTFLTYWVVCSLNDQKYYLNLVSEICNDITYNKSSRIIIESNNPTSILTNNISNLINKKLKLTTKVDKRIFSSYKNNELINSSGLEFFRILISK